MKIEILNLWKEQGCELQETGIIFFGIHWRFDECYKGISIVLLNFELSVDNG